MSTGPAIALRHEVDVPLDADRVAAFVLDWRNDPLWRRDVVSFTADPPGRSTAGQRLVEVVRTAGLRFRTPTTIDSADPLRATWSGGSGGLDVAGRRTVTALGPSAGRVVVEVELRPRGPMRLLAGLLGATFRRRAAADVAGLPDVVTGAGTTG